MQIDRRDFLKLLGAAGSLSFAATPVKSATRPHVVVVGGGFAGATVAKYLRIWSEGTIDVTLIDRRDYHTSCVLSNLVLNDSMTLKELQLPLSKLNALYGVNVVRDIVKEVDGPGRRVRLESAGWMHFDRAVIATGIAFQRVPGQDYKSIPHAWIAGWNTTELKRKIAKLGSGSTFVMSVPKSPYRCPPGPYERACMVADILKRKGLDGDARVVVLDENASIQAERHTFETAFNGIYRNIIEYVPNAEIASVDSRRRIVETSLGDFSGNVVNLIPRQHAPWFLRKAGLAERLGWADVDPLTYETTAASIEGVHLIGDIQGTGQPKSGHMANSQAKVCADAIIRSLADLPNDTLERMENLTTNSACYSPITYDTASWLTANFAYNPDNRKMELKQLGEAERPTQDSYRKMFGWASNLLTDSFS
jgi:NADPH-dependent 2,4-dienoyl-CoA reductase/sulfur reductase-like enzyme